MLVLLISTAGLAWPKLSTIPFIRDFDVYERYSEARLVKLASTSNERALQALHSRLIPGDLSEHSLTKLIDHAFAIQEHDQDSWDQRWGDILLYAMIEDLLTEDQLDYYLRASNEILFSAHEQVGPAERVVHFKGGTRSTGAFENTPGFIHDWKIQSPGVTGAGRAIELRLSTFQYAVGINDEPVVRNPRRGLGSESGFTLSKGGRGSWQLDEEFPLDQDELKITMVIDYELRAGDERIHQWEQQRARVFTRAEAPIQRVFPVTDPEEAGAFASSIHVDRVSVPIKLSEASKHQGTKHFGYSAIQIAVDSEEDISLVGRVRFRQGTLETSPIKMSVSVIAGPDRRAGNQYGIGYGNNGIKYFEDNKLFWAQAVLNGKVDVIIEPDPSELPKHPEITRYLSTPIIFRDVPIERYQPTLTNIQDQDGNRSKEWRWRQVGEWKRHEPTYGELYGEVEE